MAVAPSFADRLSSSRYTDANGNQPSQGSIGMTEEGYPIFAIRNADNVVMGYEVHEPPSDNGGPSGSAFGSYVQQYDPQGNKVGEAKWSPSDRDRGWIGNNLSWLGPGLVLGAAALGSGMFGLTGSSATSAPGTVAKAATDAMTAVGIDAATADAIIQSFGPEILSQAATPNIVQQVLATVAKIPGLGTVANKLLNFIKDPANINSLIRGGAAAVGLERAWDGIQDMRQLGTDQQNAYTDAGRNSAQQFRQTGGDLYALARGLGQESADRYTSAGQGLNAAYGQAGQGLKAGYDAIGGNVENKMGMLGGQVENKYNNLAGQVKQSIGEFKPYNITTNVGSTNKGQYQLNQPTQAVNDAALGTAGKMFGAAQAFDPANFRQNEYNLQQELFRPGDERAYNSLEGRLQAQGRLGVSNGQGINPQMASFYEAQRMRDLQSFKDADDQAMKRQGEFIGQGNAAMTTPMNLSQEGRSMMSLGSQLGNTEFQAGLAGTDKWADILGKGIGAGADLTAGGIKMGYDAGMKGQGMLGDATMKGLGTQAEFMNTGLGNEDRFRQTGLGYLNTANNNAIEREYEGLTNGLKAKFGSEARALTALQDFYRNITGAAATTGQGTTAGDMAKTILDLFTSNGVDPTTARTFIEEWANRQSADSPYYDEGLSLFGV